MCLTGGEHPGHTRNSQNSAVKSLIKAENGHKAQETFPGRGYTFGKYTRGKVVHVTSYEGTVVKTTVRNCAHLSERQKRTAVTTPSAGEDADRFPGAPLAGTYDDTAVLRKGSPFSQSSAHNLGTDPRDLEPCVHTKTCPPMFTAASCVRAPTRKPPRQPLTGEGFHTMKPHSVIKRNQLSIDATS